jgi:hypothetical protein
MRLKVFQNLGGFIFLWNGVVAAGGLPAPCLPGYLRGGRIGASGSKYTPYSWVSNKGIGQNHRNRGALRVVSPFVMHPIGLVAVVLTGLACACGKPQAPPTAKTVQQFGLTPEQASKIVTKSVPELSANKSPIKLIELDVPEVREQMKGQVFRISNVGSSGFDLEDSYLIIDQKVYQLGTAFGGFGLTSLCVADLDKNGEPELIYTYSCGSGLHRSLLCILSKTWNYRDVEFDGAYTGADWFVRKANDGSVGLLTCEPIADWKLPPPATWLDPPSGVKIGTLRLKAVKGKPVLQVDYDPSLPKNIKEQIWFYKK